ncbi:MAG: TonB-dependent receptor [Lachnospiraceae bacterium]|nr:TonB-dependent receptor [Lachnospiraceae bacterium]
MIKRNFILISYVFMMVSLSLKGQTISGRLIDGKNDPLAYANIVLQQIDSTFVNGQISNEKGDFRFSKVSPGDYRLIISSMGYQTLYVDLQGFSRTTNLGVLILEDASQQLGEVTVTADNMTGTADRKLVFPNQKQVNASANGTDLLRNLMIPRIYVNPIGNTIGTDDGGSVQLCINGRKVSQNEVTALQPSEVIRIEVLEDSSVRYDDVSVVINYVVRRYDMGGSFGYNGQQSIKSLFGRHNINGKVNFGKSEIGFYYNTEHLIFEDMWSERNETFTFEDGSVYHRSVTTNPHGAKKIHHNGSVTYNLQDDDKYMLNISAGFRNVNTPNNIEEGKLMTEEFSNSVTERKNWSHNRNTTPYMDVYFQKNMKNKQFLAFNMVGTYINTYNRSCYQEYQNNESIVDYSSTVKGEKYSFIGEGIYEKGFNNGGRMTVGVKHSQGYTDNHYIGTLQYNTRMRQANTYGYAQYKGKKGGLNYILGMGVTRSWFKQAGEEDYETWSINPQVNLSYRFNNRWSISFVGRIRTISPSLSQLSAVDQLTDSLQISRGNPDLRPYDNYYSSFRLNYKKGKVNVGLYANYNHWDNAIMEHIYRENDKFIHSYANHEKFQKLTVGLTARIGMLWDMLQLSGSINNNYYWSHGVDFYHRMNSFGGEIQAAFMYKNLTLSALYHKNADNFFGELLMTGEEMHYFSAQYRIKKVNFGLMLINPFSREYKRDENYLNQYAGNKYRYNIDDTACAIWATLSWNVTFGRNYKNQNKRMNNVDLDNGAM